MGWYHSMNHEGHPSNDAPACPDGTCPVPPRTTTTDQPPPLITEPTSTTVEEVEEMYLASSPIYHLCQKKLWLQAIEKKEPYFPPTFWTDGRFTRGSCELIHLPRTANHYYKHVTGDWLCLEIDPVKLRQLGIPIAAHRAPESTENEPLQCLKLFGGIPTTIEDVVKDVYIMQRDTSGNFYGMKPDASVPKMVVKSSSQSEHHHRPKREKKDDNVSKSPTTTSSSTTAEIAAAGKKKEQQSQSNEEKTVEVTAAPKTTRRFWSGGK